MKEPRLGDEPILMLGILGLVIPSALSGSYVPGPMVSTTLSALFSPIVKVLVFELKRIPSSYWPGATSTSPFFAKEAGLAGEEAIFTVLIFVLVSVSARSGEY